MQQRPDVVAALRWQERLAIPSYEALRFTYGPSADWRIALCVEAKHDEEAWKELAWWLATAAAEANAEELDAFRRAATVIRKTEEAGPFCERRLLALLFVLRCCTERDILPAQASVRSFLAAAKIPLPPRRHEAERLFTGPVLGELPKGKPGRPGKSPTVSKKPGDYIQDIGGFSAANDSYR